MSNRFFKVAPQPYEQTRFALDQAAGFGPHETAYEPLATAPTDANGDVYISIRTEHCQIEPYKSAVESMLASGDATEITQADYEAALPQQEMPQ